MSLQQGMIFFSMYIGYTFYTLNRKSFTFVIPQITATGEVSPVDAGKVLSSFSLAYTVGKFVSGVFVDRLSPTLMFSFGLFSCGLINLLFAASSPDYFIVLWFLNGLCQGPGWPACGKLMKSWYSSQKLGTMWSLLSTSMNVAASVGPLLASWCLHGRSDHEWRILMQVFGFISILLSLFTFLTMSDQPGREEQGTTKSSTRTYEIQVDNVWSAILSSPYIYVLGTSYMSCLFVKGALTDWGTTYLIQEKSGTIYSSGKILAIIELGGVTGRILSGLIGDFLVSSLGKKTVGHPRHLVVIFSQFVLLFMLYGLRVWVTDVDEQQSLALIIGFCIGFCLYGAISTVGLLSVENSTPSISGTTHSVCALLGNIGLVFSGYPFSYLASQFSWGVGFQISEYLITLSLLSFISFQWRNCYIGPKAKTI